MAKELLYKITPTKDIRCTNVFTRNISGDRFKLERDSVAEVLDTQHPSIFDFNIPQETFRNRLGAMISGDPAYQIAEIPNPTKYENYIRETEFNNDHLRAVSLEAI